MTVAEWNRVGIIWARLSRWPNPRVLTDEQPYQTSVYDARPTARPNRRRKRRKKQ